MASGHSILAAHELHAAECVICPDERLLEPRLHSSPAIAWWHPSCPFCARISTRPRATPRLPLLPLLDFPYDFPADSLRAAIGVYLVDVTDAMGPMRIVPLSEHDCLHALTDESGGFTGVLKEADLAGIDTDRAVSTAGPRGTVTVHNARCVHGSSPNVTSLARPLLLNTFASTSAGTLQAGTNGIHLKSPRGMPVVRGVQEEWTVFDARPCPMAPDFTAGYISPFIRSAKAAADREPVNLDG